MIIYDIINLNQIVINQIVVNTDIVQQFKILLIRYN